jgi:hypothetical protein
MSIPTASPTTASPTTDSRKKLHELLDLIREIDERRYGSEWGIESQGDIADGHRNLMHLLEGGLFSHFDADPERPVFRQIVSATRKFRGDNGDAIYFDAQIRPDREYIVRGNMAGAVYVSLTIEEGAGEGTYPTGTAAGLHDGEFDVDSDGNFEIVLSAKEQKKNWLKLTSTATSVTSRHYFEDEICAAADPTRHVPMSIKPVIDPGPPAAFAPEDQDRRVAAGIQRVMNFLRGDTLEQPPRKPEEQPNWVSTVPNVFNKPEPPGDMAFSAMDIAYTMAPYLLGPDKALVITGRFPECKFANVCLWNRYIQSYDYNNRRISLNRKQTRLEADGSYRIVIAHEDPGVPNWIDTEGRPFGMVYWRFLMPEGDVETPAAEVVDVASLQS